MTTTWARWIGTMGLAAVLATGCAGSGGDRSEGASEAADVERAEPSPEDSGAAPPDAAADAEAGSPAPTDRGGDVVGPDPVVDLVAAQREVVRTGSMRVTVDDPAEAAEEVRVRATDAGGFVADEQVRASSGTVDITVRVPGDDFDPVRSAIGELGEVTEQDVQAEDVTAELVDLESRIASQRASVERVQELLDQAGDIDQLALVEGELAGREADLESLLGQERVLAEQAALSTLSVHLSEDDPPAPADDEEAGFTDGFRRGWATLADAGRAALEAVGFALPFAVPALAVIAGWMWRRRLAAATATTATATPEPGP